jgi:hypothetical protein
MPVMAIITVRAEKEYFDAPNRVEIAELIDEFTHPVRFSAAENRLQTPVPVVEVTRRRDNVLELVLDIVEVADNSRVLVIEGEDGRDLARNFFQFRMGFDVLIHRFSNSPGTRIQSLVLPRVVEFRQQFVGDIKAGAHQSTHQ